MPLSVVPLTHFGKVIAHNFKGDIAASGNRVFVGSAEYDEAFLCLLGVVEFKHVAVVHRNRAECTLGIIRLGDGHILTAVLASA